MKLFNWLEEKSYSISRGYWNVLLILSGITLVAAIALLVWSLTPVIEESPTKEDYPEAPSVSRSEIENALSGDEPVQSVPRPSEPEEEKRVDPEPLDEGDRTAYDEALGKLRTTLGETYWEENSKSALSITVTDVNVEGYDNLTVYAGTSQYGTRLGNITTSSKGVTVTSTDASGAFTLVFRSDGSVARDGWVLDVANGSASGRSDGVIRMPGSGDLYTDRCTLTDRGGEDGDYRNNESWSMTLYPKSPGEAPMSLMAFLSDQCTNYDCKAEWVLALNGALSGLNWDGASLGEAMEAYLALDGWSADKGLLSDWTGLLGSMPKEDAIDEMDNLAEVFLRLDMRHREALTAQLAKASVEKPGMLYVMAEAVTESPFVGDLDGFNDQTSAFFVTIQGWTGSYVEAYEAMLSIYEGKSVFRRSEIQRINEEFLNAEAEAERDAANRRADKEEMRLNSLMAVGAGISAIATLALLLVLLSIRRLLVQIHQKD